jgi:hypothetical protein
LAPGEAERGVPGEGHPDEEGQPGDEEDADHDAKGDGWENNYKVNYKVKLNVAYSFFF